MRRSIVWLGLLLAATLALAACGAVEEEENSEEMTTLVYAILSEEGVDRQAIYRFNTKNKRNRVRIEVEEYFDEDGRSGKDRLLTEMASGKIPDIIDLGSGEYGMSYQQLVRRGFLEDLWPYIRSDKALGDGQLWEAPLRAAEVNGGLYTIFSSVTINTLIGDARIVGDRYSWDLEELLDAFDAMPDESTVLEYYRTKSEMFPCVFRLSLDNYLDWETGEDSFDSDSFRTALEFVNSFPDAFPQLSFEGGLAYAMLETRDRVREGRQMLSMQDIDRPSVVQALDKAYGHKGKVSFVGYPTGDGSAGSIFVIQGMRLAMSSTCRNKEAAWKFLREMLGHKFRNPMKAIGANGIPVNLADQEMLIRLFAERQDYYAGMYYHFFSDGEDYNIVDFLYEPHKLSGIKVLTITPSEVERYREFINQVDKIDLVDTDLYNIVYDACGPYLAGDRSMEDTIRLIQNRVRIYWYENQ